MTVASTFFQHNTYGTWQQNRFKTWHMIDLVLVKRRRMNRIHDVEAMCDAECDTEHRQVVTKSEQTEEIGADQITRAQPLQTDESEIEHNTFEKRERKEGPMR